MINEFQNKVILSQDGKEKGVSSGATYHCRMEGCNGVRVSTKWADGKTTFPCSRGMLFTGEKIQIG